MLVRRTATVHFAYCDDLIGCCFDMLADSPGQTAVVDGVRLAGRGAACLRLLRSKGLAGTPWAPLERILRARGARN